MSISYVEKESNLSIICYYITLVIEEKLNDLSSMFSFFSSGIVFPIVYIYLLVFFFLSMTFSL